MTEYDDLPVNPEPAERYALLAVIADTSGSMQGRPIHHLNEGLARLEEELKSDALVGKRVQVALVQCGGRAEVRLPFTVAREFAAPTLRAAGATPLAEAVLLAIKVFNDKTKVFAAHGYRLYRPAMLVLSDGAPTDSQRLIEQAVAELRAEEEAGRLTVWPVAVGGDEEGFAFLDRLSRRPALRLQDDTKFGELFEWVSVSMSTIVKKSSAVGDAADLAGVGQVPLAPTDPWAMA
jgi:uncharacterized protein YegL